LPAVTSPHAPTVHAPSVHAPTGTPRAEWLAAIAEGLGASPDLWRRRVQHDPDRRTWSLLLATPVYDAWVLGWAPGQGIAMHDHSGSAGAVRVVSGTLLEVYERDIGETELAARLLRAGTTVTFGREYRHGIANVHGAAATSIHVYSPPVPDHAQGSSWMP
jgi:predicted metal-dependent enzyme (double-stranded beta helix superfamily)